MTGEALFFLPLFRGALRAGYECYLIGGVEDCAARMVELLGDPARRQSFGDAAHEHVRRGYLLPRLLHDDLALIKSVLHGRARSRELLE